MPPNGLFRDYEDASAAVRCRVSALGFRVHLETRSRCAIAGITRTAVSR